MTDATPYRVPKEPGRWRAIMLAAIVHAALFALLWFGVRWQNETPVAVEAEVWNLQPREAAPRPQPEPEPEVKPEPKPIIKEPPKPQVIEPPVAKPDPDIVLEQEKKRKLETEKKRLAQERQEKQEKLAEQKAEDKRIALAETEAARKKTAADEAKKIAADKKRKLQIEAETRLVEQRRQEDMARIATQAGAGGSGDAPKTQGGGRADPGYTQRLSAKIKSNTTYIVPPDLENNPAVEYTVELLPDGSVRSIKKLRPSGLRGFDEAVERAIQRSEPYPADKSGTVPSSFTFSHKPKDNQ